MQERRKRKRQLETHAMTVKLQRGYKSRERVGHTGEKEEEARHT